MNRSEPQKPRRGAFRRFLPQFARRLLGDRRGTALVEFAVAAPVLILLSLGGVDFALYLLLLQKLQNAAFNVADLAARDKTLAVQDLDNIFLAVDHIIKPFDFGGQGLAIVSGVSVVGSSSRPQVVWQRSGAGALQAMSAVGRNGQAAQIPSSIVMSTGDTVIATEVFFQYEPLFGFILKPKILYRTAFFKPRLGSLQNLD